MGILVECIHPETANAKNCPERSIGLIRKYIELKSFPSPYRGKRYRN